MPLTGIQKVYGVLKLWNSSGYVTFDERCTAAIQEHLPGYTNRLFAKELFEHIDRTGDLKESPQKPEDGWEVPFFYSSKPEFDGEPLYVKVILTEDGDEIEDCIILVVSIHLPTF